MSVQVLNRSDHGRLRSLKRKRLHFSSKKHFVLKPLLIMWVIKWAKVWKKRQRSLLAEVSGKPTVRPCQEVICPIEVTVSHLKYSLDILSQAPQPALTTCVGWSQQVTWYCGFTWNIWWKWPMPFLLYLFFTPWLMWWLTWLKVGQRLLRDDPH